MKKRDIVFYTLLALSVIGGLVGCILIMKGIPVQDPAFAPEDVVIRTQLYSDVGFVTFLVSTLLFWINLIWRGIVGLVSWIKPKKVKV